MEQFCQNNLIYQAAAFTKYAKKMQQREHKTQTDVRKYFVSTQFRFSWLLRAVVSLFMSSYRFIVKKSKSQSSMALSSQCNCCKHMNLTLSEIDILEQGRLTPRKSISGQSQNRALIWYGSCRKSIKCMVREIASRTALKCIGPIWI